MRKKGHHACDGLFIYKVFRFVQYSQVTQ